MKPRDINEPTAYIRKTELGTWCVTVLQTGFITGHYFRAQFFEDTWYFPEGHWREAVDFALKVLNEIASRKKAINN
jgi:hypothetical protein